MLGIKSLAPGKTGVLVLVLILLVCILLARNSHTLMRFMVGQEINLKTANFNEIQTTHFRIKYLPVDEAYIDLIAASVEDAYSSVSSVFGEEPAGLTTVVVYPDSTSLAKSFGWDKDEKAMGVYWGGTIRILSPGVWASGPDITQQFMEEGPIVHEFTHLMVDETTAGNYNRWWTEGIAQYIEKKITGFEFADPFASGRKFEYYKLDELGKNFDSKDQQIAYWESLKVVEYIADEYGEESLFDILSSLGYRYSLSQAIEKSLKIDFRTFEQNFYCSLEN